MSETVEKKIDEYILRHRYRQINSVLISKIMRLWQAAIITALTKEEKMRYCL